ncbi:hypothetical protein LNP05_29525 [Klebsiella pneumoniae subsp. pneumoniae]|nr:hypothetical protein [Klebsiella pneumoniae subsp. pneumoniae]
MGPIDCDDRGELPLPAAGPAASRPGDADARVSVVKHLLENYDAVVKVAHDALDGGFESSTEPEISVLNANPSNQKCV